MKARTLPRKHQGKLVLQTLDALDQRTLAARRVRLSIAALTRDVADVGAANLMSEGTRQLIQHAAILGSIIESKSAAILLGEAADSSYYAAVNSQRRILTQLGLDHRDVTSPAPRDDDADEIAQENGADEIEDAEPVAAEPVEQETVMAEKAAAESKPTRSWMRG